MEARSGAMVCRREVKKRGLAPGDLGETRRNPLAARCLFPFLLAAGWTLLSATLWAQDQGTPGPSASFDSQRPALGIRVGRDPEGRILVSDVRPDSPAAQAGLQIGDEVLALNNTPVRSTEQVVEIVRNARSGDAFTLQVRRDTLPITLQGRLGSYTTFFGRSDLVRGEDRPAIGIRVKGGPHRGLEVTEVEPHAPAAATGIEMGDHILQAGGRPVLSFEDLTAALDQAGVGGTIRLQLARNGQEITRNVPIESFARIFAPTGPGAVEHRVARPPAPPQTNNPNQQIPPTQGTRPEAPNPKADPNAPENKSSDRATDQSAPP